MMKKTGKKEKLSLDFKPLNIMSSSRRGSKLDIDEDDSVYANTQRAPEDPVLLKSLDFYGRYAPVSHRR